DTAGRARLHDMLNRTLDVEAARRGAIDVFRELEAHQARAPRKESRRCPQWLGDHDDFPAIRAWLYAIKSLDRFITMPGIHVLHERRQVETGAA
ncbi:MAG: hypothetical protein AAFO01_22005, partial [Pseudomonadota bacterium]